VLLLDSHGELPGVYPRACATIVGDTFPPVFATGANFWEPLIQGTPILHGPALTIPGAMNDEITMASCVSRYEELPLRLQPLLERPAPRDVVSRRARHAMEEWARGAQVDSALIRTLLRVESPGAENRRLGVGNRVGVFTDGG
jgi:3-deoxy-D-manno-octulosonic-acid transferase